MASPARGILVLAPAPLRTVEDPAHWVVFDGPVDSWWVESLNTALDDSRTLCLASAERIRLPPYPRLSFLFETGSLEQASPATVSRCGIVHVADGDKLILSDVGSGANPTDGKLYVLDNASSADGITNVAVRIDDEDNNAVGNTMLGNPVDIAFDGANLYVAEKSQGMVLRFDNILSSAGGDVSPDASIAQAAPESVVLIADYLGRAPE